VRLKEARAAGEPVYYGDACDLSVLESCHIEEASLLLIAFKDPARAERIIHRAKSLCPALPILVRTEDDKYLESPGTKAYSVEEARQMFSQFTNVEIKTILTHADLLTSEAGQRHRGKLLVLAKKIFPRAIIKRFLPRHGLFMMIKATK
jgi:Trk K+ transport system NAD-binding subunit